MKQDYTFIWFEMFQICLQLHGSTGSNEVFTPNIKS